MLSPDTDNNWLNQVKRKFMDKSVLQKRQHTSKGWRAVIVKFTLAISVLAYNGTILRSRELNRKGDQPRFSASKH